jgi:Obg family GTPase CgtA-like protein
MRNLLEKQGFIVYEISAASGEGTEGLIKEAIQFLDTGNKPSKKNGNKEEKTRKPRDTRSRVYREKEIIVVECDPAERIAAGSDLGDSRVLIQLRREMKDLGILKKLENAGVKHGDTIRIGAIEMEWD